MPSSSPALRGCAAVRAAESAMADAEQRYRAAVADPATHFLDRIALMRDWAKAGRALSQARRVALLAPPECRGPVALPIGRGPRIARAGRLNDALSSLACADGWLRAKERVGAPDAERIRDLIARLRARAEAESALVSSLPEIPYV